MAIKTPYWVAFTLPMLLNTAGCGPEAERKPAEFEPARVQVRAPDGRIARCNTVHSLTLPDAVLRRYGFEPDVDTAVISCSLQVNGDVPTNVPAQISGTATALTGATSQLHFKEILDREAVSYIAPFSLTARSEIRFDVVMIDPRTGKQYRVELRQVDLSGRV